MTQKPVLSKFKELVRFGSVYSWWLVMVEVLFKDESYKIVGALFEVDKQMGCGFLEAVYQECIEFEFTDREIPFASHVHLSLKYKNHQLKSVYTPDAICFDKVVLELKAVKQISDVHRAQVHNYLKATGHRLGIIANFGHYPKLEYERIVR